MAAGYAVEPSPRVSVPSVLAALLAALVTAHDTQPEPDQRPEDGGGQHQEPERPCEAPEQEVETDVLGVLEHEDEQQAHSGERGDRPAAEPPGVGLRACPLPASLAHDSSSCLR